MVIVANGLLVALPIAFREAVNRVYSPQEESPLLWSLILTIIALVAASFKYTMRVAFISISRDAEVEIRSKIFSRLQHQTMAFFDQHPIGDLMSSLTNDIGLYREVLGPGIMYPLYFLTMTFPAFLALFAISPWMALLSLLPITTLPFLVLLTQSRAHATAEKVQESLGELSSMAQEYFGGIRVVKGYAIEETARKHFTILSKRYMHLKMRLAILQGFFFPFLGFFTKTLTTLLVVYAGYLVVYGYQHLSRADFVSFMWIQSFVFGPVLMLGWVLPMYQRGAAAYTRLKKLYDEPIEVKDEPSDPNLTVPKDANIELKNLTFHYPQTERNVLDSINVQIPSGSLIGITGPIGSGKSTLFRLLCREYAFPPGMIKLGGREIQDYPLHALREAMVAVEQRPFLFSKTIAENVAFEETGQEFEGVESVARLADLHDTVISFQERYATPVGERGVKLSGGQKQRLALARAFYADRSILLLDDIFSAVDSETEGRIFSTLLKDFAGKTILLITHRVALLEKVDQVLYLENGRLLEQGSHSELIKRDGRYAALYALQMAPGGSE